MGGLEENIRQFNNYNTIFGSSWFNILCCTINIIEILTTVILLGYYHSVITIDYIWWPFIEMCRLFILSVLRFDVMLKSVENYNDNRNGFKYTKRSIIICNLIGIFVQLIGAPLYLALLAVPTSSNSELNTIYTIFMCIYPSFIIIRILLSMPMICILLTGTNPIYSIHQGYEEIDNQLQSNARRRARRRRRSMDGDGYDQLEEPMDPEQERAQRYQRQIRRQLRLIELEQRQMELAVQQSRRESFRLDREKQDDEYKKAEQEATNSQVNLLNNKIEFNNDELKEEEEMKMMQFHDITTTEKDTTNADNSFITSDDIGMSEEDLIIAHTPNSVTEISEINLDPLPVEAPDDTNCVSIRIRLPNGYRSERRFHHLDKISDVLLWCNHECLKGNQSHLINNCHVASTIPHTVYHDINKNMKELKFWRSNSKRKCSQLLYVEEK